MSWVVELAFLPLLVSWKVVVCVGVCCKTTRWNRLSHATQVVDPLVMLAPQVWDHQVEQVIPTQVVDPLVVLALLAPQVWDHQVEQVVLHVLVPLIQGHPKCLCPHLWSWMFAGEPFADVYCFYGTPSHLQF